MTFSHELRIFKFKQNSRFTPTHTSCTKPLFRTKHLNTRDIGPLCRKSSVPRDKSKRELYLSKPGHLSFMKLNHKQTLQTHYRYKYRTKNIHNTQIPLNIPKSIARSAFLPEPNTLEVRRIPRALKGASTLLVRKKVFDFFLDDNRAGDVLFLM